ncbi:MAG TPA: gliding motility-associated C-terminal domain-containing protein [Chitinophagaceae bacterium]|nr:gliding motility-associated C-terminal domain-containing protein [Chitinophagaceae bacterium]
MNRIRHLIFKYSILLCFLYSFQNLYAQLPFYGDGLIYRQNGTTIDNFDPTQPVSATNPVINTASGTMGFSPSGLAVGENVFANDGSYTFYVCNTSTLTYFYYDGTTNSWVNSNITFGPSAAVNPGMGGGIIYNLIGASGQVWKTDFTGPAVLITTITDFTGGGPYDIVVDCLGNFYVLRTSTSGSGQWLRKYDPNGNMVQQWGLIGAPSATAGGGFAIVGDTLYYHNTSGFVTGIIGNTDVNIINIGTLSSSSDYANIPIGAGPMEGKVDTLYACEAGQVHYTPTSTDSLSWGVVSGNPNVTVTNNGELDIDFNESFEIYIEGFSACAEGNTVTDTVKMYLIDANINLPDTLKINGCGSFQGNIQASVNLNHSFVPYNISWSSNIGTIQSGGTTASPSIHVNGSGYFYMQVEVPSDYGACVFEDSIYIDATDYTIVPSFSWQIEEECNFAAVTFTDSTVHNNPNVSASGTWNFGNGNTSTQFPSVQELYHEQGFYNVQLTYSNAYCNASYSESIYVDFPESDTSDIRVVVCSSDMPYFYEGEFYFEYGRYTTTLETVNGCDSVVKFTLIEGPEYKIEKSETICKGGEYRFGNKILTEEGRYPAIFKTQHDCDSIVILNLIIEDFKVDLNAYPNPAYEGELVTLQVDGSHDYEVNAWHPIQDFPRQQKKKQVITFDETGTYTIKVDAVSDNDCVATDEINIEVLPIDPTVWLPNAFTPNGDGLNDAFGPQLLIARGYQIENFSIYNRYGQEVFNTRGTRARAWDGTYKGEPCEMDTYMYVISVKFTNGKSYEFKGDVHLIR